MVSRFVQRTSQFALSHGTALGIVFLAASACAPVVAQTAPVLRPAMNLAKPAPAAAPAKSTDDGTHEHLQVWGKWKIVVKNPDGTIASTTEFENSLFDKGLTAEELLAGYIVPNSWSVGLLNGPSGNGPGPCGSGFTGYCYIVPSTNSTAGTHICSIFTKDGTVYGTCVGGGLTTSIVGSAFQLTGGFTATNTGTIAGVTTVALYCSTDPNSNSAPATVTTANPSVCAAGDYTYYRKFTQALPTSTPAFTPISVTSGQIIQVTVALSFS